jgi:CheY-like chemotaxis protein
MEDNLVSLNVIVRMLKRAGVSEVISAPSGLEGLEGMFRFVRESDSEASLSILCFVDVNMPHLSGVDVVKLWNAYRLRASSTPSVDAYFYAVTATDESRLPKSIFRRIISKPLRNEVLVKLLEELRVVDTKK